MKRKYIDQSFPTDHLLVEVWLKGAGFQDDCVWIDAVEEGESSQVKLTREQAINLAQYILGSLGAPEKTKPQWVDL